MDIPFLKLHIFALINKNTKHFMWRIIFTNLLILSASIGALAQNKTNSKQWFFEQKGTDNMPIGAYYYPEHWPETDWEPNLKKMAELGFKFTHIAEFAWDRIEPTEGNYNFEWIDKVLAIADKNGLKVMLCTPTACPPTWMVRKYPETVVALPDGRRRDQGGRRQGNHHNTMFLDFSKKVIEAMAKKYGKDPRVIGWQIDNEPHIEGHYDYSADATRLFREWLKNKYSSVTQLNTAWGAAFWAQTYQNFEQVNLPIKETGGVNHHHLVDFQLFTAQKMADFLNFQAELLRTHCANNQFITTNYAYLKFLPEINPFLTRKGKMDFATYTMYLTNTWLEYGSGGLNYRLGSGLELSYLAEFVKSHSGISGIMELQPGQINWGAYNAMPLPGAVRMWLFHNYGLGSQFVNTYRFRQPVFGGEMFHKGIMETDGKTVSPGGEEYVKVIQELKNLEKYRKPNAPLPASIQAKNTAILWKHENLLDFMEQPHTNRYNHFHALYTWYQAAKASGAPVTFLTEDDAFDVKKYPIMIAPAYQYGSKTLLKRFEKYVNEGGHLVLTARSFTKDSLGHLWKGLPAAPLSSLTGSTIKFFDQLPANTTGTISMDGANYSWSLYADVLKAESNTEIWGKHELWNSYSQGLVKDPYYVGSPVLTHKKLGAGTVSYCGVITDSRDLEIDFLKKVYRKAGAQPLSLPKYAFVEFRDGFYVMVNYTSETVQAPIPPNAKVLLGAKGVLPGEVCIWME